MHLNLRLDEFLKTKKFKIIQQSTLNTAYIFSFINLTHFYGVAVKEDGSVDWMRELLRFDLNHMKTSRRESRIELWLCNGEQAEKP